MRRFWIPITVLIIVFLCLLYLGGMLTGSSKHEFQNPYSREKRLKGSQWGLALDEREPNAMSAYYRDVLKQQNSRNIWVPSEISFKQAPGDWDPSYDNPVVPPVTYLDPIMELAFLKKLPDNRVRLAVINSLYQPTKKSSDKAVAAANKKRRLEEIARVRRIISWYKIGRLDPSTTFSQWWRDNSEVFGISPDGNPTTPVNEQVRK